MRESLSKDLRLEARIGELLGPARRGQRTDIRRPELSIMIDSLGGGRTQQDRSKRGSGPELARRIEARIGELLGPAEEHKGGRGKTFQHAERFHPAVRHEFRALADAVRLEPGVVP
jgi:hypothetical protein